MNEPVKLQDVVALIDDLPESGLVRGHVGTIVEILDEDVFEVEFCDDEGRTYAMTPVKAQQLMVLHHQPVTA